MARPSEGWKFKCQDPRTGNWVIQFTHNHQRHVKSTRERDKGIAAKKAAEIYSAVTSGKILQYGGVIGQVASRILLEDLTSAWMANIESSIDPDTASIWLLYDRVHWRPFFKTLDQVTPTRCADYWRDRLNKVQVSTIRHELSALRNFVRWAADHGYLPESFPIAGPGKKSTGTVAKDRRPIALTEDQINALISKLPEQSWTRCRSRSRQTPRFWVRPRFEFAWEMGMRPEMVDSLSVPENYKPGDKFVTITIGIDKNRMARELPLTKKARKILDHTAPEKGIIFGDHDFRIVLRKAAREAKIPEHLAKRVCDQTFRSSRLTHWADNHGTNLTGMQYMAGHTKTSTTEKYIKASLRAAQALLGEK